MRIIEGMEQGSESWYDYRLRHLTATDSVILSGKSPWRTPYDLWIEKVTGETKLIENDAMRRGKMLEPLARETFTMITGIDVTPAVVESTETPWAAASLDGICCTHNTIVEIKVHSADIYDKTLRGYIPDYYIPQFQKQLYVTELDWLYYFPFDGDHGHVVKIYRDDDFINKMVVEETRFWERVQNIDPPETCEKDFIEIKDEKFLRKVQRYLQLKADIEWLENEESAIKTELLTYAENGNVMGGGVKIQKVVRKGAIDYKAIPELSLINLEQYRRDPIEYFMIKESS